MATDSAPLDVSEVSDETSSQDTDGSRREDHEILTGKREYVGDLDPDDTLHAVIYRSPHAHAVIEGVDISGALDIDGVVGGFTAEDLPDHVLPLSSYPPENVSSQPFQDTTEETNPVIRSWDHMCLATDRVRFVGEPVAVLVAEDRYIAEDGLEKIRADYETLPSVIDEMEAVEDDAKLLYEEWGTNKIVEFKTENGDVDSAFAEADNVIEEEITHHRFTGTPMETRRIVAEYDKEDRHLDLHTPTQTPHTIGTIIENSLDLRSLTVEVFAENIGGGFGQKAGIYPEDQLAAMLAVHYDRPVKWVETRKEHMVATIHAREQTHSMKIAVDDDGTIRGLEDDIVSNAGAAYPGPAASANLTTTYFIPGTYEIQNFRATLNTVATNKTPIGAHRGFGKAESAFVIERLVSIVSQELDIDPIALRQKNFIQPEQFPYESATGHIYDSGDYPQVLEMAADQIEYEEWRHRQRTHDDPDTEIGIGIGVCVEPSSAARRDAFFTPGYYGIRMRMDTKGQITVYPEDPDIGTSHEASLVKIVSTSLDVDPEKVRTVIGNTEACPFGSGSYSSRFSVIGTTACYEACQKLADKLKRIAAKNFSVQISDLSIEDGAVRSTTTDESLSFKEISHIAHHLIDHLPDGMDPTIDFTHFVRNPNMNFYAEGTGRASTFSTYPYAADMAVVEVNTETGELDILEYVSIHDCGNILMPKIVEGQHLGALAHGFGGALYEELPYDDYGQPLNRTFMDYLIPTANEIPEVTMDHIETPSPFTPGGHKGAGETGTISPPPTLTNAVEDALNIKIREKQPLKPNFIWEKIQG